MRTHIILRTRALIVLKKENNIIVELVCNFLVSQHMYMSIKSNYKFRNMKLWEGQLNGGWGPIQEKNQLCQEIEILMRNMTSITKVKL